MFDTLKELFGFKRFNEIKPQELQEKLDNSESLIIIDVRSKEEYDFHGHISQAQLMPLATFAEDCQELPIPKEKQIICVDRAGQRSEAACKLLVKAGFSNVTNLVGGMKAWRKAGLPAE
jgi:rhodanese-related sulfurtransferase